MNKKAKNECGKSLKRLDSADETFYTVQADGYTPPQMNNEDENMLTKKQFDILEAYIRHGMIGKADEMYKELLTERKELISDEPEYAYRAYIDFITQYRRDLKDALQCFLDAKQAFRDSDIQGFWELELMIYTNTFNNPESFENERLPFLERGLISEVQYHRGAFIANMVNLNREKAREHHVFINSILTLLTR